MGIVRSYGIMRSMKKLLLSLLVPLISLWGSSFSLQPHYTLSNAKVMAKDLFPSLTTNFDLLTLPNDRYEHKISASILTQSFLARGVKLENNTSLATVIFTLNDPRLDQIADALASLYAQNFPRVTLSSIDIQPISLVRDTQLSFIDLFVQPENLKTENGIFEVRLGQQGRILKKILFRFATVAYIPHYKAKANIPADTIITLDDVSVENVRLSQTKATPLLTDKIGHIAAAHYIRAGSPIYEKDTREAPVVIRNSGLMAYYTSGGIELSFPVTALEGGPVGGMIRVKNSEGRIFRVKVLSSTKVVIP